MDLDIEYIFTNVIDENYLKTNYNLFHELETFLISRHSRSHLSVVLHKIIDINKEYQQQFKEEISQVDDYSNTSPIGVLFEIICFLSSIELSLKDIRNKKILFIGSNYGIEVLILRALGIASYGIESDDKAYKLSEKLRGLFEEQFNINGTYLYNDDFNEFVNLSEEKFDLVIGRNLNPLADVPLMLKKINLIMNHGGISTLQWDALYKEEIALDLYSPKNGIYYNENLRGLLDTLFVKQFGIKKTRARFDYLMRF